LLFVLLICINAVFAQNKDFKTIVSKGQASYELEDYEQALSFFKQAYRINKHSDEVIYYMALSYLALNQNEEAVAFSGKLMEKENEYCLDAYLVSGSAWQKLGREKRSIRMYKEGLKLFPASYLLHYNLALELFNEKSLDEAENHAIRAVELENGHGSSHLLLSYIMNRKGERIKSMLPLYYFLLIEQNSERSESAYDFLQKVISQGAGYQGQKDIRLVKAGYKYMDFGDVELALNQMTDKKDWEWGLSDFTNQNLQLFSTLSKYSHDKAGFWWNFYADFFVKIEKEKLTKAFSYFISSCKYNKEVLLWMSDNQDDFKRFTEWLSVM